MKEYFKKWENLSLTGGIICFATAMSIKPWNGYFDTILYLISVTIIITGYELRKIKGKKNEKANKTKIRTVVG